jgi:2-polyprenyl-3-methyl-5-hydroxy-6-metoxy-1,4-benzoquinol methylase
LAKNAENLKQYDVQIVAAVLEHIEDLKAQGKNIVAPEVTHVIIK